jgi:hypothetical protein
MRSDKRSLMLRIRSDEIGMGRAIWLLGKGFWWSEVISLWYSPVF